MAGSQWWTPFDPPEPDALASAALGTNAPEYAAQVAERPARRRERAKTLLPQTDLNPQERISGGFGAVDVEHRDEPGYPGSFLPSGATFDPLEAKAMGVPVESGGFYYRDLRPTTSEDYFNPISQQAGMMNIYGAAERDREAANRAAANRRAMLEESQKPYRWTKEDQELLDRMKKESNWGEPDLPIRRKLR